MSNEDGSKPEADPLARLDRVNFVAEKPVRRIVGSGRLNPLPHAGTISSVLFIIVVLTGIYLTFFFEFGFEATPRAIEKLTDHPIQRLMRSLHRYASAALVVTVVIHAWRIFVAHRFNGPRRWAWLTGWAALVSVLAAGVTGYWMLWDQRAQLINEAIASTVGVSAVGSRVVTSVLTSDGSGWQVILLIWLGHVLVTVLIGYFLWRHLRRSNLPWLPPRLWTGLMLGSLVVVSIAFPAELLRAADPARIVESVPVDPFFLFLLPGFESFRGLVVFGAFVLVTGFFASLPWLLDRSKTKVVEIDEDACVGCELCVVDCPYKALRMEEVAGRSIAVLDADLCVACGICVGSCVFDAIELEGATVPKDLDAAGQSFVVACQRHGSVEVGDGKTLLSVRCVGVIAPTTIGRMVSDGASSVQIVGCPPGDCSYGVGNRLAEERLTGERRPRVANRFAPATTRDFVAPTALEEALTRPGTHLSADPSDIPSERRRWVRAGAVVLLSVLVVAVVTTWQFAVSRPDASVLIVVHHEPGAEVEGLEQTSGAPGTPTSVLVSIDGVETTHVVGDGGFASAVIEAPVEPGISRVVVSLIEGGDSNALVDDDVAIGQGQRLVVEISDATVADAETGRRVFESQVAGCDVCHSVTPGVELVGPNLSSVALLAAERVPGLDAAEYLLESIVDPDAYVVDGYPAGQMLSDYEERLSDDEIEALVQYLLTLDG